MDATEPTELIEDDREDNKEDGERETEETDELSNKLPQPHVGAGAGAAVLCSPSGGFTVSPDDLRSQCFSEKSALSLKAQ